MSPTNIFFSFGFLFLGFVSCSYANLIGDVCAKAPNPSSCNGILESNPGAVQTQDLPSLGLVAIDMAQGFSKSAQALATSLGQTTQDPKTKDSLNLCVENFVDALEGVNECREALTKKDKGSLNIKALAIYTLAVNCNDGFEGQEEPEKLRQATKNVIDTSIALLALSNML
ncbi:hypothetical protein LIER_26632 [Lithospermum erythrorhizon]|uniref:Pectinesterase inhibitor domain-containing protein n=1 Tax=Lithospermum erythrorhizon TaxID=34254 RepID=A0AAV3REX2_LITER